MYALREMDPVGDVPSVGEVRRVPETNLLRTPYAAAKGAPPRWPRLVREAAEEWQPEEGWQERPGRWEWNEVVPAGAAKAASAEAADLRTDPEDELFLLGERCAQAYMEADALHYQAMKLLAEFDRREGWQDTGFSSTAEWLAWRIGIKPNAARERVRTALALESLPLTSEAMRNGELSFTKARTLTRVARPDTEATLLDFARAGSAAKLERMVRGWKTLDRKGEIAAEQIRHRSRRFSAWVGDDGMVEVRGRLDPEVGALLMRAVEAASDALYREGATGRDAEAGPAGDAEAGLPETTPAELGETTPAELGETTPEQRRADAMGLVAERALAAGFNDSPISGSRAERYQVMLHVDAGTLEEEGEAGQSELDDGTRVTAVTSRRIACDAGLVHISHGHDGGVVGAGARKRTVPPSVRRALEARDRGCRFPGCGLRFTDAHHVKHWADGGETTLRNLVLLCRRHHRAVHEGGVRVCLDVKGQVVFFTPRGKALLGAPPTGVKMRGRGGVGIDAGGGARVDTRVDTRIDTSLDAALEPEKSGIVGGTEALPMAGAPRWKRDADIPWALEARAWEALDSG